MKKLVFLIILMFIVLSAISAQNGREFTYSFQANPLYYFLGILALQIDNEQGSYQIPLHFEFQYALNSNFNLSITPMFYYGKFNEYNSFSDGINGTTYNAKQLNAIIVSGILYKPFNTRLKGMHLGAFIPMGYSFFKSEEHLRYFGHSWVETVPEINDNFFLIGIGTSIGYQWIFKNGFTISLGIRGEKIWTIGSKNNTGVYSKPKNLFGLPFSITLPFKLGYSF